MEEQVLRHRGRSFEELSLTCCKRDSLLCFDFLTLKRDIRSLVKYGLKESGRYDSAQNLTAKLSYSTVRSAKS